jgi:hypothetical protein
MNDFAGSEWSIEDFILCHSGLDAESRNQRNTAEHFSLRPDTTPWIPVFEAVSQQWFWVMCHFEQSEKSLYNKHL